MSRFCPWQVWFADLGVPVGHEQRGQRPAVVVSSRLHLKFKSEVVVVVPLTTRDRGLPHHVRIASINTGLDKPSWARTEDLHSISTDRLISREPFGSLEEQEIEQMRRWMIRMIDIRSR